MHAYSPHPKSVVCKEVLPVHFLTECMRIEARGLNLPSHSSEVNCHVNMQKVSLISWANPCWVVLKQHTWVVPHCGLIVTSKNHLSMSQTSCEWQHFISWAPADLSTSMAHIQQTWSAVDHDQGNAETSWRSVPSEICQITQSGSFRVFFNGPCTVKFRGSGGVF